MLEYDCAAFEDLTQPMLGLAADEVERSSE
jgi:hypothetical protein